MNQIETQETVRHLPRTVWMYVRFVFQSFAQDQCRQAAAALSYTTLFAVVPMMLVIISIIGSVPALAGHEAEVKEFISNYLLPTSGTEVLEYIEQFARQASNLTAIGVLILFATAIMLLRTIEKSINQIWGLDHARRGVMSFLLYWAIISLGPLLLIGGLAISSYLGSLYWFADEGFIPALDIGVIRLLPWLLTAVAFTLVYVAVPNCYVPWKAGAIGALVAATLFEVAKKVFATFVTNLSSYKLIYGAFALVPVFLLWIHICWTITLLGVEIVKAMVVYQPNAPRRAESYWFQMLDILSLLQEYQQRGKALPAETLRDYLLEIHCENWSMMREFLLQEGLVAVTENGDFVLARDLNQYRLSDLMMVSPMSLGQWSQMLGQYAQAAEGETLQAKAAQDWNALLDDLHRRYGESLYTLLTALRKQKGASFARTPLEPRE